MLATPVFLLSIAIEYIVGVRRGRNTDRLNDMLNAGRISEPRGAMTAVADLTRDATQAVSPR